MRGDCYKGWSVCLACKRLYRLTMFEQFRCLSTNECIDLEVNLVSLHRYLKTIRFKEPIKFSECADAAYEEIAGDGTFQVLVRAPGRLQSDTTGGDRFTPIAYPIGDDTIYSRNHLGYADILTLKRGL